MRSILIIYVPFEMEIEFQEFICQELGHSETEFYAPGFRHWVRFSGDHDSHVRFDVFRQQEGDPDPFNADIEIDGMTMYDFECLSDRRFERELAQLVDRSETMVLLLYLAETPNRELGPIPGRAAAALLRAGGVLAPRA